MPRLPELGGAVDDALAAHRHRLDDLQRRLQPLEVDLTMRPSTVALRLTSTPLISNSVTTLIDWEHADDPFGAWSLATPGEIVVRRDGQYLVQVQLTFAGHATGKRWALVTRNSTDLGAVPNPTIVFGPGTGVGQGATGGGIVRLLEGDVIRTFGFQDSGTGLAVQGSTGGDVGSYVCVSWIGR